MGPGFEPGSGIGLDAVLWAGIAGGIVGAVCALWAVIALFGLFRKAGQPAWAAWIPGYNLWVFYVRLGRVHPALVIIVLAVLVVTPLLTLLINNPLVQLTLVSIVLGLASIIVLVINILAVIRISRGFRLGTGMIVVGVLFSLIWLSIIAWSREIRWFGHDAHHPMPQYFPAQPRTQGGAVDVVVPSLQPKAPQHPAPNTPYWAAGQVPAVAPHPPVQPPMPQPIHPHPVQPALQHPASSPMPPQQPMPQQPVPPQARSQSYPPSGYFPPESPQPPQVAAPLSERPVPIVVPETAGVSVGLDQQPIGHSESNPWAPPGHTGQPVPVARHTADSVEISLPPTPPEAAAGHSGPPMEQAFDEEAERTVLSKRHRTPQWQLMLPNGEYIDLQADRVLLGRRPDPHPEHPEAQQVAVADEGKTVSKNHAMLLRETDTWQIIDLESTNGVVLIAADGNETLLPVGGSGTVQRDFLLGEAKLSVVSRA